jgi:hypothetical protein
MEHLLCECENYSEPLWSKLAESWTRLFSDISHEAVSRVDLGQTNVIYNIPHPLLLLHVHDQATRNALLLLIQEVKRDIIYRRMNLPPSAQQATDPRRITAHIDSIIRRLCSYLQYIGLSNLPKRQQPYNGFKNSTSPDKTLKDIHAYVTTPHDTVYLSLANTNTCGPLQLSTAAEFTPNICNCTLHIASISKIPSIIAHHTKHTSTLSGY